MFATQIPCSITDHTKQTIIDTRHQWLHPSYRQGHTVDATHRLFPLKGRTCKHVRHVSRAGSEEGLKEGSKLYVEGAGRDSGVAHSNDKRQALTCHNCVWLADHYQCCHAGLKEGIDEDELLARQIGLTDASQMSTTQEKYKQRMKEKLLEVSFCWTSPCTYVLLCNDTVCLRKFSCTAP